MQSFYKQNEPPKINPYTVEMENIDYDKLIKDFGCKKITPELIQR